MNHCVNVVILNTMAKNNYFCKHTHITHTTHMKNIIITIAIAIIANTMTAQMVKRPQEMNINAVLDAVPTWLPASQQAEIRDDLEKQYHLTVAAIRAFDAGMADDSVYTEAAEQTYGVLEGYFNQTEIEQASGQHDGWQYEINVVNPYRYAQVTDFVRNLKRSITKMNDGNSSYTLDYITRNATYWGVDLKLSRI